MKHILTVWLTTSFLLLLNGCVSESTDDMRHKYRLLNFNMPVDEVLQLIGMPDIKFPELIGETWVYKDDAGLDRIVIYVSPQKEWDISKTSITPRLIIETGRLLYKEWIDHELVGAS